MWGPNHDKSGRNGKMMNTWYREPKNTLRVTLEKCCKYWRA